MQSVHFYFILNTNKIIIDSELSSFFSVKEVMRYKGLLGNLAKRDFLVRYKQAHIGVAWALIKPLINTLIFGYIASKITTGSSNANSFLYVASGMLLWQLFSNVFNEVSNSIVGNANLFSKVYFPKIIIPISSILVCLMDFLISLIILIVLFIVADKSLNWHLIFAPVFVFITVVNGFGIGLFFATLFVKYRDVRFVVPIIIQFGMYASPVIFASAFYLERIPDYLHWIFCLNPMVSAIDGFKFCLLNEPLTYPPVYFIFSTALTFVFLFIGIKFFYKYERNFVDYI